MKCQNTVRKNAKGQGIYIYRTNKKDRGEPCNGELKFTINPYMHEDDYIVELICNTCGDCARITEKQRKQYISIAEQAVNDFLQQENSK